MGDIEQDGTQEDVVCEITKLSPPKKDTVVEYRPPSRRTSLKIGLFVSIGLNVIFAVLFVVVFIMLSNMNARLSRFEVINDEKLNRGRIISPNNETNNITPTERDYNTRSQEPLVNVLLLYVKSF
jgi:hypothetical protein